MQRVGPTGGYLRADVVEYRERYRKHLTWQAEYWTHPYGIFWDKNNGQTLEVQMLPEADHSGTQC